MQRVAEAAYSPYLPRTGGLRPGPLLTDYAAAVAGTEAWVALVDSSVVGFLLLVPEDDAMLLDNVAVLPSHHGLGVGRVLLEQALYERIGYVETHRGGEEGLVRVFYEKPLG